MRKLNLAKNANFGSLMYKNLYKYQELPTNQIELDSDQPRKYFGTDGDKNKLRLSIDKRGILHPIAVNQLEDKRYIIIDGHRRYIVAKEIGLNSIPCIVYSKLKPADLEISRFEMQNNRRQWRPLERANSFERIKKLLHFKTNQQLADYFGYSKTLVNNSLQLREIALNYLELMKEYGLSESYHVEFVRLKPKIRKIGNFEVQDIIINLFERVQNKVIQSAKDFRKLGRIFLRASANEQALIAFLSDPDMTIRELEKQTTQSGLSFYVEQLMQQISKKKSNGEDFSPPEKEFIDQLRLLLNKIN